MDTIEVIMKVLTPTIHAHMKSKVGLLKSNLITGNRHNVCFLRCVLA